jgi:leader peptidase (prepilin peptidase)/N-methyltransferase
MGVATTVAIASLTGLLGGAAVPFAAYRLSVPAGDPPRLACVSCGQLIPVGWVRWGRCAHCVARLGPPAWLTASTGAVSCGLLAAALGARPELPLYVALGLFGVLLGAVDLACQRLPHGLVVPAIGVSGVSFALVAAVTGEWSALARSALGAIALGVVFLVLFLLPGDGLGLGDVKLAVLLGGYAGWLGWREVLLCAALPWLVNAPITLALLLSRRITRKTMLPLGPAMLSGALLAILLSTEWPAP